jgi:hypothetical protein
MQDLAETNPKKPPRDVDIWSCTGLNRLTNEDLLDRIDKVDANSCLIRWHLLWELRKRFAKSWGFYSYLESMKNQYFICEAPRQTISREVNAGKFVERHNIHDLSKSGILKSTIYELSRPGNEKVSESIFRQVRHKSLSTDLVIAMLNDAKTVATIEHAPPLTVIQQTPIDEAPGKPIFPHGLRILPVNNNVVLETAHVKKLVALHSCDTFVDNLSQTELAHELTINTDTEYPHWEDYTEDTDTPPAQLAQSAFTLADVSRQDLVDELSRRAINLNDDDLAAELFTISACYGRSAQTLIVALQKLIKVVSMSRYNKQLS